MVHKTSPEPATTSQSSQPSSPTPTELTPTTPSHSPLPHLHPIPAPEPLPLLPSHPPPPSSPLLPFVISRPHPPLHEYCSIACSPPQESSRICLAHPHIPALLPPPPTVASFPSSHLFRSSAHCTSSASCRCPSRMTFDPTTTPEKEETRNRAALEREASLFAQNQRHYWQQVQAHNHYLEMQYQSLAQAQGQQGQGQSQSQSPSHPVPGCSRSWSLTPSQTAFEADMAQLFPHPRASQSNGRGGGRVAKSGRGGGGRGRGRKPKPAPIPRAELDSWNWAASPQNGANSSHNHNSNSSANNKPVSGCGSGPGPKALPSSEPTLSPSRTSLHPLANVSLANLLSGGVQNGAVDSGDISLKYILNNPPKSEISPRAAAAALSSSGGHFSRINTPPRPPKGRTVPSCTVTSNALVNGYLDSEEDRPRSQGTSQETIWSHSPSLSSYGSGLGTIGQRQGSNCSLTSGGVVIETRAGAETPKLSGEGGDFSGERTTTPAPPPESSVDLSKLNCLSHLACEVGKLEWGSKRQKKVEEILTGDPNLTLTSPDNPQDQDQQDKVKEDPEISPESGGESLENPTQEIDHDRDSPEIIAVIPGRSQRPRSHPLPGETLVAMFHSGGDLKIKRELISRPREETEMEVEETTDQVLDLRKPFPTEPPKACAWCGKGPLGRGAENGLFCSELCFHMYRRDSFKKRSNCYWCSSGGSLDSTPPTGGSGLVDESRFCSDDCLTNYKVKLFSEEVISAGWEQVKTFQESNLASDPGNCDPAPPTSRPSSRDVLGLITPAMWRQKASSRDGNGQESQSHSTEPQNRATPTGPPTPEESITLHSQDFAPHPPTNLAMLSAAAEVAASTSTQFQIQGPSSRVKVRPQGPAPSTRRRAPSPDNPGSNVKNSPRKRKKMVPTQHDDSSMDHTLHQSHLFQQQRQRQQLHQQQQALVEAQAQQVAAHQVAAQQVASYGVINGQPMNLEMIQAIAAMQGFNFNASGGQLMPGYSGPGQSPGSAKGRKNANVNAMERVQLQQQFLHQQHLHQMQFLGNSSGDLHNLMSQGHPGGRQGGTPPTSTMVVVQQRHEVNGRTGSILTHSGLHVGGEMSSSSLRMAAASTTTTITSKGQLQGHSAGPGPCQGQSLRPRGLGVGLDPNGSGSPKRRYPGETSPGVNLDTQKPSPKPQTISSHSQTETAATPPPATHVSTQTEDSDHAFLAPPPPPPLPRPLPLPYYSIHPPPPPLTLLIPYPVPFPVPIPIPFLLHESGDKGQQVSLEQPPPTDAQGGVEEEEEKEIQAAIDLSLKQVEEEVEVGVEEENNGSQDPPEGDLIIDEGGDEEIPVEEEDAQVMDVNGNPE